ncbi:MAG: tripartite tricarboxylate transporter TctB family protein [Spirochaetes bacterium]|nr:tripartite tricarboxylate transporter TctB family protein [Spirochaetota bacterium]
MRNADRIISIVLLGICAFFFVEARSFTRFGRFFPLTIIIILAALSLFLLVLSFVKPGLSAIFGRLHRRHIAIAISIVLIGAWGILINVLGFVVTSVILFTVINVLLDEKHRSFLSILKKMGIITVVVGVFYLFFAQLLLVPFPRGCLF